MHAAVGAVATRLVAAACRVAAASEWSPRTTAPRAPAWGAVPFQGLARPAKKAAKKFRPDVNETGYRVMLEATGQAPKTL